MCGRYGFADPSRIKDRYEIENWDEFRDLKPRYNIAPSQWLPVITRDQVTNHNKAEDREVKTYTIITTEPNSLIEPIHNRMPVILKKTTENIWLDPTTTDPEKLLGLLVPFSPNLMEAYPVFSTVNDPANDYSDIIKGIPAFLRHNR